MKNWFLSSTLVLFALICCEPGFAQNATSRTPPAKEDQRDLHRICPTVSVSCPANPDLSEAFDFTVTVGGPDITPTYTWEVANGEILLGQGTPTIRVQASGRLTVTATVRVGGFDRVCSTTASCSTVVCDLPPRPTKFDSYGALEFNQVKAKLDQFAVELKQRPASMANIRGYSQQQREPGEAQKAADDAKQYLVEKFDIEKDRIRIADGGTQEEFMIELWLIPQGSYLPEVQPKKDPPKN